LDEQSSDQKRPTIKMVGLFFSLGECSGGFSGTFLLGKEANRNRTYSTKSKGFPSAPRMAWI
jgi:hypothetical protein